jgi:hypothetical protein
MSTRKQRPSSRAPKPAPKPSAFSILWKKLKKKLNQVRAYFREQTDGHELLLEKIQLTFLYFFAFIILVYNVKNSIRVTPFFLIFLEDILKNPVLKMFGDPNKLFLFYTIAIQVMINRPIFKFSRLVQFNTLLLLLLEMTLNVLQHAWALIFNRELNYIVGQKFTITAADYIFYYIMLFLFGWIYLESYIRGINGRYPSLPGKLQIIRDCVAFWFQMNTDTMRFGPGGRYPTRKKDDDEDN